MIIKLFSWGRSQGGTNYSYLAMFKAFYCQTALVNNPNISGMLITLSNIEKITLSIL